MVDKKVAWETFKKMRIGVDVKVAYDSMKEHQLAEGLMDYASFVECFYEILARMPSVSSEAEQMQQSALRREAKAMGLIPMNAKNLPADKAVEVVKNRRAKSGVQRGSMTSLYNSMPHPPKVSAAAAGSFRQRRITLDDSAPFESTFVPVAPARQPSGAFNVADVVKIALAAKKDREMKRLVKSTMNIGDNGRSESGNKSFSHVTSTAGSNDDRLSSETI